MADRSEPLEPGKVRRGPEALTTERVRRLSGPELASAAFLDLLRLAVEVDDEALGRVLHEELPALEVSGAVEHGVPIAFTAVDTKAEPLVIEYIAVAAELHGRGYGRVLIQAIRASHPGVVIRAETDDDAVEFYRRLGFAIGPADADPRWPDRQRYDCRLSPGVALGY